MDPNQQRKQSLLDILDNPDMMDILRDESFKKKIEAVKKDKGSLIEAASKYSQQYADEIEEGTKKRTLLLEDGQKKGLKEEDALKEYGKFIPSRYTPVLNFLYFILRENNQDAEFETLRTQYNQEYGQLEDKFLIESSENIKPIPEASEFVYGNVTYETFKKIKKLKSLSRSSNEHEAFAAYTQCLKMCKEHGLDMDKIPLM